MHTRRSRSGRTSPFSFTEQLRAPLSWWVLGEFSAALLASTVWAGFDVMIAAVSYLVCCGGTAALLLVWGSARIQVSGGELRAGTVTLPLGLAGEVTALSEGQARAMRGPAADPRAYLLIRPYLKRAVYIDVVGEHSDRPYWLVGTRRPAELAAAIGRSRPQARAGGTAVG